MPLRMIHSPRAAAFTLVEVLVALALVGILLALLIPAAFRARELASTAECTQKLRSLGAEVLSTFEEHNGALPWYEGPKGRPGMWWYRVHSRTDFAAFSKKMTCPLVKKPYQYGYTYNGQKLYGNYRYNKYMGYQHHNSGAWIYPEVRLQSISRPGRLALLADDRSTLADRSDDSTGFEAFAPITISHRNATVGLVFCVDGHVEELSASNPNQIVLYPPYLNNP